MAEKQLYGALVYDQRILCEKRFSPEDRVTVGPKGKSDFCTDLEEYQDTYTIFEGGKLLVKSAMPASVSIKGKVYEVGEERPGAADGKGLESYDFSEDDWAILNLADGLDLVICYAEPQGAVFVGSPVIALSELVSSPAARALVFSFVLHSAFIFAAAMNSQEAEAIQLKKQESRWVEVVSVIDEHKDQEEPEKEPVIEDTDNVIMDDALKDLNRPKTDDSKLDAPGKADKPVGLQAALGGEKLHDMQSLFGSTLGLGDANDFMPETEDGDAFGTGLGFAPGLGGLGGGGGGGGGGFGAGIGGLGGGGGGGGGSGKLGGPKKSSVKHKPKLAMDAPKQGAFCKEANIRDVVQKRANALRNCYEQQLLANPNLSGKIIVFWKIGLDGKVMDASIKSTTMNNGKVESCLTQTVRRLRFDQPDGGICVVEFPFIFTAAQ